MSREESADRAYRIILRIVTPLGMSVLALAELVDGAIPAAEWVFMGIFVLGLFLAFRYTIDELDRTLNSETREVLG